LILRNIMSFIKDSKRTLIELVLSFSLMVTFLTRFIELTNKLYPDRSYIVIGMTSLPSSLHFLIPLSNILSSKTATIIILVLITLVFVYELIVIILKLINKTYRWPLGGRS